MTNEQLEVARRILELADSAKEALDYVVSKVHYDYESAHHMLVSVVVAFAEIEAVLPIVDFVDMNSIQEAGASLQEGFRYYVERSEAHDYGVLAEVLRLILVPRLDAWHRVINGALRPYLVS